MNFVLEELKIEAKAARMVTRKAIIEILARLDATDYGATYGNSQSGTWEPCHARSIYHPSHKEYEAALREFERAYLQQKLDEIEEEYRGIDGNTTVILPASEPSTEEKQDGA